MKTLTREEILNAPDRRMVPVEIPEWGGEGAGVYVRSLTAFERANAETKWHNYRKNRGLSEEDYNFYDPFYASFVVCDESGKLLFTPNEVEALSRKASKPLERIVLISRRLNGNSIAEIEAIAKNSVAVPSCSTGSD